MTAQGRASGSLSGTPRSNGWLSFLLSERGVAWFWIAYCVVHAVFRFHVSHTLSLDDSRSNELAQELALGYQNQQPPLYEWLLWGVQQAVGTGLQSLLIVRYSLIALVGLSCFYAVRTALKDKRWAAAASLSLAASYPIGWTFHEWGTQTILLCIACFATLQAAILWLEKPSWRAAFWLGAAIGLGLQAKFSYGLFLGGILIAAFSMKETRQKLFDRRLALSAAVALLMIAPYVVWLIEVRGDVAAAVAKKMIPGSDPYSSRVVVGLTKFSKSVPLFLLPWLAFIALLAPRAFGFGRAGAPAGIPERLTLRTMIAAAVLAAAGIAAIGATNIAERYMHAILVVAPVYVFARIARYDSRALSVRPIAILAVVVAVAVLGIRVAAESDFSLAKRATRLWQVPYQPLAAALKARGIEHGTVLTPDVRDAGNLRAFLPGLRVIASDSLRILRPPLTPEEERFCMAFSSDADDLKSVLPPDAPAPDRIDVIGHTAWFGAPRRAQWFLVPLDPKSPSCR